jgi:hypothetical protein
LDRKDYYTAIESGFFNNIQFKEMNKTFNPKYTVTLIMVIKLPIIKETQELSYDTMAKAYIHYSIRMKKILKEKIEWTRDAL